MTLMMRERSWIRVDVNPSGARGGTHPSLERFQVRRDGHAGFRCELDRRTRAPKLNTVAAHHPLRASQPFCAPRVASDAGCHDRQVQLFGCARRLLFAHGVQVMHGRHHDLDVVGLRSTAQ